MKFDFYVSRIPAFVCVAAAIPTAIITGAIFPNVANNIGAVFFFLLFLFLALITGYLAIRFFSYWIAGRPLIVLGEQGFMHSRLCKRLIPWSEITYIQFVRIQHMMIVWVGVNDMSSYRKRLPWPARQVFRGYEKKENLEFPAFEIRASKAELQDAFHAFVPDLVDSSIVPQDTLEIVVGPEGSRANLDIDIRRESERNTPRYGLGAAKKFWHYAKTGFYLLLAVGLLLAVYQGVSKDESSDAIGALIFFVIAVWFMIANFRYARGLRRYKPIL